MSGRTSVLPRTALGLTFFLGTTIAGVLTGSHFGIASDVANYFEDSLKQLRWFGALVEGLVALEPGMALSREVVFEHWRWWPERIPHPPLSRELSGLGYAFFGPVLEPLVAYRLAVVASYGLLVSGAVIFVSWARGSYVAGIGTGLALLTIPCLFAYGHLANADMFLAAFWFGAVATLYVHLETGKRRWLWISGLFLGAAAATKFTGLLAGPVLLIWLLLRGVMKVRTLAVLAGGALLVFFVTNPVLWVAPLTGLSDYLSAGLGRYGDPGAQITTLYFGEIFAYRPPWHYPFVWTAIVVPIPILLAAAVGVAARERGRLVGLSAVNLAVLYGVLLLPTTPLHDGVRLFLPAFPFLAILAGSGAERLVDWLHSTASRHLRMSRDFMAALVLLVLFTLPVVRTVEYHPHQLSYFNALIGGIQGADRKGLEVTSQKEVLSPAVLSELSGRIPPGSVVNPGFFMEEMCFYQAQGYAPTGWILEGELGRTLAREPHAWICVSREASRTNRLPRPPVPADFVFVLNRPGQHTLLERSLSGFGGSPFYEVRVQGVSLLQVFRLSQAHEG